jgi:hypothetical protein
MSQPAGAQAPHRTASFPPVSTLWGRLWAMAVLWGVLGAVVGAGSNSVGVGAIAVISAMIAGTLVLSPLGVGLALIGGRPQESLFGGLGGWSVGALAGAITGVVSPLAQASFTLLVGALFGATFCGLFRLLKGRLLYATRS